MMNLKDLMRIIKPPRCGACRRPLLGNEECLCHRCMAELPRTNMHTMAENPVAQMYWGRIPLERATSFIYYRHDSPVQRFIHRMKYRGRKEYGYMMGRLMGRELMASGFFDGVDFVVPVPLHPKKERQRGYNQSEWIARGVAEVTGVPLRTDIVVRCRNTETQTRKLHNERMANVADAFVLRAGAESLAGRHILIVDDVLTTSATTIACADAFRHVPDVRFSVLTLAVAR
jgi:ComF family protein